MTSKYGLLKLADSSYHCQLSCAVIRKVVKLESLRNPQSLSACAARADIAARRSFAISWNFTVISFLKEFIISNSEQLNCLDVYKVIRNVEYSSFYMTAAVYAAALFSNYYD